MIELRCINMTTGHIDVIHKWGDDEVMQIVQDFKRYMWKQDKSTDHFYDVVVTEEGE